MFKINIDGENMILIFDSSSMYRFIVLSVSNKMMCHYWCKIKNIEELENKYH